ncbi:MAG: tRNA uridine-5-carboxymethylaminomethyl(34) synthesis GTPase MnmE [Eubacteriales bacterium]|jgi:tRNA modification GTPase|nr:tRNA uridine-5-carboxymethylaminomethyl(34) synthesis GTPase MnmE [Eubacteriales bacterium]
MTREIDKIKNQDFHSQNAEFDTIAAFSTPPGQSGLAVLRLSGPDAAAICDRLFRPYGDKFPLPSKMSGYTLAPGIWADIDEVVLAAFRAPHSYTGEDVYEISCHGGNAVRQAILDSLINNGARLAEPGEFSKRAFINGKMDLAQAEAVMDMIHAESEQQTELAFAQLRGRLSQAVRSELDKLYGVLAFLETLMDWDEEEERSEDRVAVSRDLASAEKSIEQLANSFRYGRIVREGLSIVIAGRPNAGKSSLLNALTAHERAIVSDIPGTTRDTIEIDLNMGGYLVHLTDTAGLAVESDDPIEQEGIKRAQEALQSADLVLWVLSPPLGSSSELLDEMNTIKGILERGQKVLLVLGKDDLRASVPASKDPASFAAEHLPELPTIAWSAKREEDLQALRTILFNFIENDTLETDLVNESSVERSRGKGVQSQTSAVIMTHSRHKALADKSLEQVRAAHEAIDAGLSYDLIATLLRSAVETLASMSGDDVSETLIETIFSRFCIGK